MSHTPTPWKFDGMLYIWGPTREMVADIIFDDLEDKFPVLRMRGVGARLPQEENAEFIVKACNENEELHATVASLRAVLRELVEAYPRRTECGGTGRMNNAIAKAKEVLG